MSDAMDLDKLGRIIDKLYSFGLYDECEMVVGDVRMMMDTLSGINDDVKEMAKKSIDDNDFVKSRDLGDLLNDIAEYNCAIEHFCQQSDGVCLTDNGTSEFDFK